MKRLLLIRHANAAAYGQEPGDHARPLSQKGHYAAQGLGTLLSNADWVPDVSVVSTAARTRETWEGIAAAFGACPVHFEEALYLASPKALMQVIAQHSSNIGTLAVIAHNPGIAIFAGQLVEDGFDHNAPAARAVAGQFKTGWAAAFELREEGPRLARLFDPRTL